MLWRQWFVELTGREANIPTPTLQNEALCFVVTGGGDGGGGVE
jgi:hypothetical protein